MKTSREPWARLLMGWALALLVAAGVQAQPQADPPGRVGRLADLQGRVSWFDLEQGRWDDAQRNRPLTTGDRLATGRDAQAELRVGSTSFKLGEATEIELLRLDDERVRVQLHRGSLAVRLRSTALAAETEFGTDEAWLMPRRGGLYRLQREDDTTFASVWRGELTVDGDAALLVDAGQRLELWREGGGRSLRHRFAAPLDDAFAARVLREDRDEERSAAAAHVSPEMTGFEDLDRYGRWDRHPDYGTVWIPVAVADDWVPYRYGRWVWVRPWGWTWVDDAPWGFAPFHYGRWAHWRGRWVWVPGSYVARPVFAPALVAWIDGPAVGIGLRFGGPTLSWVPLAPWEVYRPHYRVSPGYHERVNPPDLRRWRPPPGGDDDRGRPYGHQRTPGAVTVVSPDVLRPRPRTDGTPPVAPPPPRTPGVPLPSRPQPGHPAQPPQPVQPVQPLQPPTPAAPLTPVQPATPIQPPTPAVPPPPRGHDPLPSRPSPRDERERGGRPVQPPPPAPAVVTPPPPPLPAVTPPPPRTPPAPVQPAPVPAQPPAPVQPKSPPPAQPQTPPRQPPAQEPPRPRERDKEREKEREKDRDDGRGGRGTPQR